MYSCLICQVKAVVNKSGLLRLTCIKKNKKHIFINYHFHIQAHFVCIVLCTFAQFYNPHIC